MSFWFTIHEGFKGFRRARVATAITISSVAFALLLVGFFLVFSLNVDRWIGDKRSQIELEVFLDADLNNSAGQKIATQITEIEGVSKVVFVSKKQAAARFKQEFGRDIYDVLDSNPLPASCTVKIKSGFQTALSIEKINVRIKTIDGVSDIVYEKDILNLIDHYLRLVYLIAGGIGVLLIIIAIILLYNTVRLTILARKDIIEIMQLVGATSGFIRRPFVIEGFLQGLLGAVFANLFLFVTLRLLIKFVYPYLVQSIEIYGIITVLGVVIGIVSSKMSVSKHLQKL